MREIFAIALFMAALAVAPIFVTGADEPETSRAGIFAIPTF